MGSKGYVQGSSSSVRTIFTVLTRRVAKQNIGHPVKFGFKINNKNFKYKYVSFTIWDILILNVFHCYLKFNFN